MDSPLETYAALLAQVQDRLGHNGERATIQEIADRLCIGRSTIHQRLAGTRPLRAEAIVALEALADSRPRALAELLARAIDRVELAHREGDPILSDWLPLAKAAIAEYLPPPP